MHSFLILFTLFISASAYTTMRLDGFLEDEGFWAIRSRRSAESSSSEEKADNSEDKSKLSKVLALTNIIDKQDYETTVVPLESTIEGSGEGSGFDVFATRATREVESSGTLLRDDPDFSGDEGNFRTLRDLPEEGSGSLVARLADTPLEGSGDEDAELSRLTRFEGSGEGLVRPTRAVKESSLDIADSTDDLITEGSSQVASTRFDREAEGSGEFVSSEVIRVIREGSGNTD